MSIPQRRGGWLQLLDKGACRGRKIIISDMEIFVDGKYYPLERGNEADHFYRRLKEASGR